MAKTISALKAVPKGRPTSLRRRHFQQEGEPEKEKYSHRISTGKYDMHVLREISRVEEAAQAELVTMYQVEGEDELPVSFDLHQLLDMEEHERRPFLGNMLQDCPTQGVPAFMDKYLERVGGLNPYL